MADRHGPPSTRWFCFRWACQFQPRSRPTSAAWANRNESEFWEERRLDEARAATITRRKESPDRRVGLRRRAIRETGRDFLPDRSCEKDFASERRVLVRNSAEQR